jgi:hypothetical protein
MTRTLQDAAAALDAVTRRFDAIEDRRTDAGFDHPYAWHVKNVERMAKKWEAARRKLTDKAIAAGHGHTKPTELRQMPEYKDLYQQEDAAYAALEQARDYAVHEKCAYSHSGNNYRFEWYTSKETAKWRNQAKKRGY